MFSCEVCGKYDELIIFTHLIEIMSCLSKYRGVFFVQMVNNVSCLVILLNMRSCQVIFTWSLWSIWETQQFHPVELDDDMSHHFYWKWWAVCSFSHEDYDQNDLIKTMSYIIFFFPKIMSYHVVFMWSLWQIRWAQHFHPAD